MDGETSEWIKGYPIPNKINKTLIINNIYQDINLEPFTIYIK